VVVTIWGFRWKRGVGYFKIPCQSSKLENFHLKFIYRISYKIAKRQTLEKRISPIGNCRYAIKAKMSDRSELGSDCIQLLSILDLKASFMFVISKFQYQMVK